MDLHFNGLILAGDEVARPQDEREMAACASSGALPNDHQHYGPKLCLHNRIIGLWLTIDDYSPQNLVILAILAILVTLVTFERILDGSWTGLGSILEAMLGVIWPQNLTYLGCLGCLILSYLILSFKTQHRKTKTEVRSGRVRCQGDP